MTGARSIAAAQTVPKRGDVAANLRDHVRLIEAAAAGRVQVVVFPELSLTGYELDLADGLAFSRTDPRLEPLLDLAESHHIDLVVGAPVRLGDTLHIGALLLAPDRSVGLYTKQHLGAFPPDASANGVVPAAEATVFSPGEENPLLQFAGNTAAVAVCADVGRADHAARAAARGARNYLASMFVIPADFEQESNRLRTRATQHHMAVVFANYGGPSGGLPSAGRSAIWSEQGELLAQLGDTGPGLVIAIESANGWRAETFTLSDF